jgi:hypothetical protein
MKQKLWKNRKPYFRFKVVLYSNEGGGPNKGCTFDTPCNTKIPCGTGDKTPDGVNNRCNPPESTQDGARNIRCNLARLC